MSKIADCRTHHSCQQEMYKTPGASLVMSVSKTANMPGIEACYYALSLPHKTWTRIFTDQNIHSVTRECKYRQLSNAGVHHFSHCHRLLAALQQGCLVFVQNSVCVVHTNHVRAAEYLASQNGKCLKKPSLTCLPSSHGCQKHQNHMLI